MTTQQLLESLSTVVEGIDLKQEKASYHLLEDVTIGEWTLNRGTARVAVSGDMNALLPTVKPEHRQQVFTTTLSPGSPVLELGYPLSGQFVMGSAGTYLDLYLGVAQKLLDENHPSFRRMLETLGRYRLTLRREINTDDFLTLAPGVEGVATPQQLAARLNQLVQDRYQHRFKTFFTNSGAEAIEAGMKLAQRVTFRRFLEKYGVSVLERVMGALGIQRKDSLEMDQTMVEDLWEDYPFFLFAYKGAFHGRTMGALSLTQSKKVHQLGFSKMRWVKHLTFNGDAGELEGLLDPRPITEILDAEGGLARVVLEEGRVPVDLAALVLAEPMQGEGGYLPGDTLYFQAIRRITEEHQILLMLDEVQTFARTGRLFCGEHLGISPDIVSLAKGAVVGAAIARADYDEYLESGWHSNTWGGGKVIEVNAGYTTLEALTSEGHPVFDGRTPLENSALKGVYLERILSWLQERHPQTIVGHRGFGLMRGLVVRRRADLVDLAWKRGLKLLGCGLPGEEAVIRLLFLTDVLTHELEEFARVMDEVLTELEA